MRISRAEWQTFFSALLFPAALSSSFTRTRFASLFPATSSTFFPSAPVGFIHGCPRAAFRLFAADAPLLVTTFNLRRLFCFDVYFFLLPRAMDYLQFKLLNIGTNLERRLALMLFSESHIRACEFFLAIES